MDEQLRKSVRTLTTWLGQTIQEKEGVRFFRIVETVRLLCKDLRREASEEKEAKLHRLLKGLSPWQAHRLVRAFTLYFQLVNLAEEQYRVSRIASYEQSEVTPEFMSLTHLVKTLKSHGVRSSALERALNALDIEPVLTAHPTEVKRSTILRHLQRIADGWGELLRPDLTIVEQKRREETILETLEVLWQTKQVRDRRLTVGEEVANMLRFFRRTLLESAVDFRYAFQMALASTYPGVRIPRRILHFGSWIGGDRDGNPNVLPETSLTTLSQHRTLILTHYQQKLDQLFGILSHADRFDSTSPRLKESITHDLHDFPQLKTLLAQAEPGEPYRVKLMGMRERLTATLREAPQGYRSPAAFLQDLQLIQEELMSGKGRRVAQGFLQDLMLQVETFGFHLARLDFRQHMGKLRLACQELLGGKEDKIIIWSKLIQQNPLRSHKLSPSTAQVLAEFRNMAHLQQRFGAESSDHYLLSMTQQETDIWRALFLARQAGLIVGPPWCMTFDLVPLFETVDDLKRAPIMMARLWQDSFYRTLLKSRGGVQEIMLGYSDSNKAGGYLAANLYLYQAQRSLSRLAKKHGVRLRFFHGRGGSIDRGGGPAYQAIQAAPDSVVGYQLRMTEQGEVVAHKYNHRVIARRNFEQLTNAVLTAGLLRTRSKLTKKLLSRYEEVLQTVAETSMAHYHRLVHHADFYTYFSQATPIDLLERIPIASRPVFRSGGKRLEDLRAIPWVFAWTQSRHLLSAWYGLGTALNQFSREHGDRGKQLLRRMYREWPFFAHLLDNAQVSLAKADMGIARRYAGLVRDEKIGMAIFNQIYEEYQLAVRQVLAICEERQLLEKSPVLRESIQLRNPYVDALNRTQLEYLRVWRQGDLGRREQEELLLVLLLTVNGIAFGMKGTG